MDTSVEQSMAIQVHLNAIEAELKRLPVNKQAKLAESVRELRRLLEKRPSTGSQQAPSLPPEAGSEVIFRVLDEISAPIWCSDAQARSRYINRRGREFTGGNPEDGQGDWIKTVHPDDRPAVLQAHEKAFQARRPFEMEYRLQSDSGESRWVHDTGQPYYTQDGSFAGYIHLCLDVSRQKNIEAALQESEAMFKGLFDFAPDATIAVNKEGVIQQANRQAQLLFGYSAEEMVGNPVEMLIPESFSSWHRKHVRDFGRRPRVRPMGAAGVELYGRRKNGEAFPADVTLAPLLFGSKQIFLSAIRDISDRKRAEEALHVQEQFIHTALSVAPILFFRIDQSGVIQLSLGNLTLHEQEAAALVGESVYKIFADTPDLITQFERALRGESFEVAVEIGGRLFYTSYAPMQNGKEEITGVIMAAADITLYKQVSDALRQSEARFHAIFNQATLGLILLDSENRVVESNPAFQQLLGYSREELAHMSLADFSEAKDMSAHQEILNRLIEGKDRHAIFEKRYRRKDGEVLWGRVALSLLRDDKGAPAYSIGIVENITRQKEMRAELEEVYRRLIDSSETERLHLSQELHDGPLQELQAAGFLLSAQKDEPASPDGQAALEEAEAIISAVSTSLRAICGELRPPALAPFGLEKAIRSYLSQLQERHPEMHFSADLMPDGQVLAEPVRLALYRICQHTLTNVLKHSGAKHVRVRFAFDDQTIKLEIRDDGRGFEVPRRWVELAREGHFGLVGSFERAEAIGGELKVVSSPGKGTTVTVTAPRQKAPETGL